MTTENTEHHVDKSKMPPGPWHNEPDRIEWRHASGLPCLIVRNGSGALCGYVGVPPLHPWHGKDYNDVPADVHGGLTYADKCGDGPICHVPQPGEPDAVWWLGFDCAHCFDFVPGVTHRDGGEYRDVAFVRREVEALADQIRAAT